jgi:two-component system cell cycle sensor histidine kinase/response regulator CckA
VRGQGDGLAGVPPGQWVRLRVTDTGPGIDESVRQRIFEPFFSTKPVGKGSGLGLSMVHGVVTQGGGHIGVESEPGRGATIDIWFPRTHLEPGPRKSEPAPTPLRGYEVVLVAEDEEAVRRVVVTTLTNAGYQVVVATDGVNALEVASTRPNIDLLLTDVVMPGLDGRKLAEALLAARPSLKVLFISGHPDDRLKPGGLITSPDLLDKPFDPRTLLERVRAALDRRD